MRKFTSARAKNHCEELIDSATAALIELVLEI
jgi:hypothetical protein